MDNGQWHYGYGLDIIGLAFASQISYNWYINCIIFFPIMDAIIVDSTQRTEYIYANMTRVMDMIFFNLDF